MGHGLRRGLSVMFTSHGSQFYFHHPILNAVNEYTCLALREQPKAIQRYFVRSPKHPKPSSYLVEANVQLIHIPL